MIHGAHVIIYSKGADADRAFIRDVLGFSHVDGGGGWLIFGLPPAEVVVHPTDGHGSHELFLMCDDIEKFRAEMAGHGVPTGAIQEQRWGMITDVALPSGAKLSVYEPRHARPEPMPGALAAKPGASTSRTKAPGKSSRPAQATPVKADRAPAKRTAQSAGPAKPSARPPAKPSLQAPGRGPTKSTWPAQGRPPAKAQAKPPAKAQGRPPARGSVKPQTKPSARGSVKPQTKPAAKPTR